MEYSLKSRKKIKLQSELTETYLLIHDLEMIGSNLFYINQLSWPTSERYCGGSVHIKITSNFVKIRVFMFSIFLPGTRKFSIELADQAMLTNRSKFRVQTFDNQFLVRKYVINF